MIPALIVGGLTAWYLGLRAGIVAAIATVVALVAAMVVPGMTITVYALVLAWAAALYFFGPRLSKAAGKPSMGSVIGQAQGFARKLWRRG